MAKGPSRKSMLTNQMENLERREATIDSSHKALQEDNFGETDSETS